MLMESTEVSRASLKGVGLRPFEGFRVAARFISNGELLCLPYDCLTPELEVSLRKSPHNAIHLEEPRPRLASGANLWSSWKRAEVLEKDAPSYYFLRERFEGRQRLGLLAMIPLSRQGGPKEIWPHERCYRRFINRRKKHFLKMRLHLSPIFLVAEDRLRRLSALLESLDKRLPESAVFAASLFDKVERSLVGIHDPALAEEISQALEPQDGYLVADGHHRYNAACELAQEGLLSRTVCYVTSSKSGVGLLGKHPPIPGRKALKEEPPSLEEIIAGAKEGRLFARKTTYFWPKIPCGLVYAEL